MKNKKKILMILGIALLIFISIFIIVFFLKKETYQLVYSEDYKLKINDVEILATKIFGSNYAKLEKKENSDTTFLVIRPGHSDNAIIFTNYTTNYKKSTYYVYAAIFDYNSEIFGNKCTNTIEICSKDTYNYYGINDEGNIIDITEQMHSLFLKEEKDLQTKNAEIIEVIKENLKFIKSDFELWQKDDNYNIYKLFGNYRYNIDDEQDFGEIPERVQLGNILIPINKTYPLEVKFETNLLDIITFSINDRNNIINKQIEKSDIETFVDEPEDELITYPNINK